MPIGARSILLVGIRLYQRLISPYKGFSCAYRTHTGRASCSNLGYRAIRRYGILIGLRLLRQRTYRCGIAQRRFHRPTISGLSTQRGFCDFSCDLPCDAGCDLPNMSGASKVCDYVNCCDCGGCDGPSRKNRNREREKYVHIPPGTGNAG